MTHDSCICTLQSIKCSVVSPDQELFVSDPDPDKNERNTDTKSKFYFCWLELYKKYFGVFL